MKIRIRKRGAVSLTFKNGMGAALWYDHGSFRTWVLQLLDPEGNQIGPGLEGDAAYFHCRLDAGNALSELAECNGGIGRMGDKQ